MADEDPFADLGETLDDAEASDGSATEESSDGGSGERDPATDRAFTYEDAVQRPFYAREATVDDFDSWLNYELERELSERGYQNIVVREMTDALLRTVVEENLVDEVAARFESAREDASDDADG